MDNKLRNMADGYFCWIDKRVLNLINGYFGKSPKRQRTARSVYLALTEISSNNKNQPYFTCSRALIALKGAVSHSTLDRYLNVFVAIRIIRKANQKFENRNLANWWYLLPFSSIHHFDHTNKDDGSHYGYNKREMFRHNQSEHINKHIKEEKEISITNAPNTPLKGYFQNTSNKPLKDIQNGANSTFLLSTNVTNVTDKEGRI